MEKQRHVIILDDGIEKQFTVNRMKATKLFFFTNSLLGLLAREDNNTIRGWVNQLLQTGVKVPNVSDEEIDKFSSGGIVNILFDVVKSILANSDEQKQFSLLEPLINCIEYKIILNQPPITMSLKNDDPNCEIDAQVVEIGNLYKLFGEVLKLNYANFFTKRT